MLRFLPAPVKVVINFLWGAFWTTLIAIGIITLGLFKIIPIRPWQRFISALANNLFRVWGYAVAAMFSLTQKTRWQVEGGLALNRDSWYLIMANHLSWVDILVLMKLASKDMPMPRFFLKQQLFWIPFIGLGCWVLDMPFMKRYSRQQIAKKPHLQGKDIETTRKSCEKFKDIPTTVINFCEGTRFTEQKKDQKQSPYQHLLPPKAGGTAFTLQAMKGNFDAILDITIVYPDRNPNKPLVLDFLAGRLRHIHLHIDALEVTDDLVGDYFNDPAYQAHFQSWLNARWALKDKRITETLTQYPSTRDN
ncbi:MAG: acyltransferase [Firmicutes bacterium]|nr:acyltransferase [Bacillota bacterium]